VRKNEGLSFKTKYFGKMKECKNTGGLKCHLNLGIAAGQRYFPCMKNSNKYSVSKLENMKRSTARRHDNEYEQNNDKCHNIF
jgi:hypothetical protein